MSRPNRILHQSQDGEDDGKEFPTRFALTILIGGLSFIVGFIPWLALTLPTSPRTDLTWHHNALFYQYNQHSISYIMKDLDVVKSQGFGAIIIGPVNIPNTEDLEWSAKTLEKTGTNLGPTSDIDALIKKAHEKGLKVLFEFEPNHSNLDHAWFKRSEGADNKSPYRDLYVWQNPQKDSEPPNTWQNVAGKSAWTFSKPRGQYYFSQYDSLPDLNYRNPTVPTLIGRFLSFWAERGIDGYYIRSVSRLYENQDLTETDYKCSCDKEVSGTVGSQLTSNQEEALSVIESWRNLLKTNIQHHVFLATEASSCDGNLYQGYIRCGADIVVHPDLWQGVGQQDYRCIWQKMSSWHSSLPVRRWPGWMDSLVSDDEDECRQALHSLFLTSLPGSLIVKQKLQPLPNLKFNRDLSLPILRKELAYQVGETFLIIKEKDLLVFVREAEAKMFSKYIIAINFNPIEPVTVDYKKARLTQPHIKIPYMGTVVATTGICKLDHSKDSLPIGTDIYFRESNFTLAPNQGVIFQA